MDICQEHKTLKFNLPCQRDMHYFTFQTQAAMLSILSLKHISLFLGKQEPVDLLNRNGSEKMSRFCFNGESKSENILFTSLSWHCIVLIFFNSAQH